MGALLLLLNRIPPSWIHAAGVLRGRSPRIKALTDWLPAKLRNREGIIQYGLGRGLGFNGGGSAAQFILGTHDLEVQYALYRLLRPGFTAYDIGANVGFTAVLAAKCVGPAGKVVCFEPLPEAAAQIVHNARLNGSSCIQVHQVAVGRADGEAEFFLSEASTWGRLADSGPAPLQTGSIRVPVRSLDSMSGELLPKPDFIKMDVEGGEAEVIAGARALLAAARPVMVIELHHTYRAVVDSLAGLDYKVHPLTLTGEPISDGEFQLLAYPQDRTDVEGVWQDLAAGKMAFA